MSDTQPDLSRLNARFEDTINRHGYPFQYAILAMVKKLFEGRRSPWIFIVAEFPVEANGTETRIDFVLRHKDRPHFIVAECKRANPALSDWCFLRAPVVARNHRDDLASVEQLERDEGGVRHVWERHEYLTDAYHLAVELKTDQKGDSRDGGRGAVESAVTQVLRGVSGLASLLARRPSVAGTWSKLALSPVVFTTANLYSSSVDLLQADPSSGEISPGGAELEPQDWISYQYHMSPSFKPGWTTGVNDTADLARVLKAEFIRSVPIVNPAGLADFLGQWAMLWEDEL